MIKQFIPVSVALLIVIALAVGYWFMVAGIESMAVRLTEYTVAAEESNFRGQFEREAQKFAQTLGDVPVELATRTLKVSDQLGAIEVIESTARRAGVVTSIQEIKEGPVSEEGAETPFNTLSLTITSTGTWKNVLLFGQLIETLPIASTLQSADLVFDGSRWMGTYRLSLVTEKNI
ncbi:MAG: hypothetical protein RLZZ283_615 [Candidatus Parcubacteria bacterium]